MNEDVSRLIVAEAVVAANEPTATSRRRWFRRTPQPRNQPTACENCGSELAGAYCAVCGQHAIDYRRSFARVLADVADSFFNWDTKFLKSVGILLVRPWRLTNDFNAGRRVRNVHPLRLYLLASIAFFLMAKLLNLTPSTPENLSPEGRAELDRALSGLTTSSPSLNDEQRARIDALRGGLNDPNIAKNPYERALLEKLAQRLSRFAEKKTLKTADVAKLESILAALPPMPGLSPSPSESPPSSGNQPVPAQAEVAPKLRTGPKMHFRSNLNSPLGTWLETRAEAKLGDDGTKAQLFMETVRSNVPSMMLGCIPLFALILKLLYVRQGRYYVEHLVYALHVHTFVYTAMVVITLVGLGAARLLPSALQILLVVALSTIAATQVFVSVRHVYQQSWVKTTVKFLAGGLIYFFVVVAGVAVTILATLLLP